MEKTAYVAPPWAASSAPEGYSLEILKEGTIIEKVPLSAKTHYILGRMGGVVDILMEHVSISRQHCCLQFRDDGVLMALDLGSAQGSFLNKTKLAKDVYQRVNVGDILRFGASTRMYIVNGPAEQMPSEYDSANMKLYREKLIQNTAKFEAKKLESVSAGASWGFDEDAENPPSDEDEEAEELPDYVKNDDNYDRKHGKKYSAGLDDEAYDSKSKPVSEKSAATLEKIRVKERKIQNMQEEIRRIYLKESSQADGLSEGQNAAVSRNDKRILELKDSINELLDNIKSKSSHKDSNLSTFEKNEKKKLNDQNNDELLDTTMQTADATTNWRLKKKLAKQGTCLKDIQLPNSGGKDGLSTDNVLTYEGLSILKTEQMDKIKKIQKQVLDLEKIITDNQQYFLNLQNRNYRNSDNDDVDNFVLETRSKESVLTIKNLKIEESSATVKLKNIEKLLKIATPSLDYLAPKSISITHVVTEEKEKNQSLDQGKDLLSYQEISQNPLNKIQNENKFHFLPPQEKESKIKNKNPDPGPAPGPMNSNQKICADKDNTTNSEENGKLVVKNVENCSEKNGDRNDVKSIETEKKSVKHQKEDVVIVDKKESKKRARLEENAQMQSLSNFMKFAEEEKKKTEKEEKLKILRELNGSDYECSDDESEEKIKNKNNKDNRDNKNNNDNNDNNLKKIRGTNEFTSNAFEIGKSDFIENKNKNEKNEKNGKKSIGPIGPRNTADSTYSTDNTNSNEIDKNGKPDSRKSAVNLNSNLNVLEGGETVWIPPKNQTGDGRTLLNARLGY